MRRVRARERAAVATTADRLDDATEILFVVQIANMRGGEQREQWHINVIPHVFRDGRELFPSRAKLRRCRSQPLPSVIQLAP
jgi:hypothetical protein